MFEVYTDKYGEFRWRLMLPGGLVARSTEGFASKSGALSSIAAVKRAAANASVKDMT